jgi:hypothetical protein
LEVHSDGRNHNRREILMVRFKSFGVLQTAKVLAVLYMILSAPLVLVGVGMIVFGSLQGVFILLLPLLYGVLGFIFTAFFCWIYNLVATVTGGIEVELEVLSPEGE